MNTIATLAQQQGLSAAGWTLMIACITLVCSLVTFCYYRVLKVPRPSEHRPGPLDADTKDQSG